MLDLENATNTKKKRSPFLFFVYILLVILLTPLYILTAWIDSRRTNATLHEAKQSGLSVQQLESLHKVISTELSWHDFVYRFAAYSLAYWGLVVVQKLFSRLFRREKQKMQ